MTGWKSWLDPVSAAGGAAELVMGMQIEGALRL
jgi:hypothetical protein